jgi:dCTP deaminase
MLSQQYFSTTLHADRKERTYHLLEELYQTLFNHQNKRFQGDIKVSGKKNKQDIQKEKDLVEEALTLAKYNEDPSVLTNTDLNIKYDGDDEKYNNAAILSNLTIIREIVNKKIIIEPFLFSNLSNCSYDVTLGRTFYRFNTTPGLWNIYNELEINKACVLLQAPKAKVLFNYDENKEQLKNIDPEDYIIILAPGERILAHTNEAIGSTQNSNITTTISCRSSLGRAGISICMCSNFGNPGYSSFWTLEISNHSINYNIPLIVGTRIAQIAFHRTDQISNHNRTVGKYQESSDVRKAIDDWGYHMMLPRLYADKELSSAPS